LEILPETTVCKRCAQSRERVVPTITHFSAIDPQPYIDAKIPPARLYEKSFVVKKPKKTKKAAISDSKKYTQIGGLKKAHKNKAKNLSTKDLIIPVVFHSQGKSRRYDYRLKGFQKTFKVSTQDILAAQSAKYSFYVDEGILYLDRKGKAPNVRIGSFQHRKEKK
jgi:hypothetical protein